MKKPFTEKEQEIMNLLAKAHNIFLEIDPTHPSHIHDWVDGIHRCQYVIKSRVFIRDYPNM